MKRQDLINAYLRVAESKTVDKYTAKEYAGFALSCGVERISTVNVYGETLDWQTETHREAARLLEEVA